MADSPKPGDNTNLFRMGMVKARFMRLTRRFCPGGVNFTLASHNATSCERLCAHRKSFMPCSVSILFFNTDSGNFQDDWELLR